MVVLLAASSALFFGALAVTIRFALVAWRDTWPFFVTGLFAPGISQILFTRSVGVIGPSRTAIAVGISPVLSAAIAVTVLGEPLHVALVLGTLLVVAGGTLLVGERRGPAAMLSLGIALSLGAALLFSVRDNLVRWAARGSDVSGLVAGTASLVSATLVILIVVASRPSSRERIRLAALPFVPSGWALSTGSLGEVVMS